MYIQTYTHIYNINIYIYISFFFLFTSFSLHFSRHKRVRISRNGTISARALIFPTFFTWAPNFFSSLENALIASVKISSRLGNTKCFWSPVRLSDWFFVFQVLNDLMVFSYTWYYIFLILNIVSQSLFLMPTQSEASFFSKRNYLSDIFFRSQVIQHHCRSPHTRDVSVSFLQHSVRAASFDGTSLTFRHAFHGATRWPAAFLRFFKIVFKGGPRHSWSHTHDRAEKDSSCVRVLVAFAARSLLQHAAFAFRLLLQGDVFDLRRVARTLRCHSRNLHGCGPRCRADLK